MSGATEPSDAEHREYVALHLLAQLREVVDELDQRLDLLRVRGLGEAVERRLERGQRRLEGVEQVLQALDVLVGDVDDAGRALHQGTGRRGDAVDLGDQLVGTVHELEHPGARRRAAPRRTRHHDRRPRERHGVRGRSGAWPMSIGSPQWMALKSYKSPCATGDGSETDRMTRRTAALRHQDTRPGQVPGPEAGTALLDVLVAFHHPIRRWLCEVLSAEGPANVGRLAARTDLAVGSVSHHLKALHRYGFVEPAPALARDTRESWWRLTPRDITWASRTSTTGRWAPGRRGRRAGQLPPPGAGGPHLAGRRPGPRGSGGGRRPRPTRSCRRPSSRSPTSATADRPVTAWYVACVADAEQHPDAVRRPVRAVARVFPSGPVRP